MPGLINEINGGVLTPAPIPLTNRIETQTTGGVSQQHTLAVLKETIGGGGAGIGRKSFKTLPALASLTATGADATHTITEVAGKAIIIEDTAPNGATRIIGVHSPFMAGTNTRTVFFVSANLRPGAYIGPAWGFGDGTKADILCYYGQGGSGRMQFTAPATRTLDAAGPISTDLYGGVGLYYGLRKDATNFYWEWSADGVKFATIHYIALAGYTFSALSHAYMGLFTQINLGANYPMSVSIQEIDDDGLNRTYDN